MTTAELEKARIALALARVAAELLDGNARRALPALAGDVESLAERLYHLADEPLSESELEALVNDPIWGPS